MEEQAPRSSETWIDEVAAEAALLGVFVGAIAVLHLERVKTFSGFLGALFG